MSDPARATGADARSSRRRFLAGVAAAPWLPALFAGCDDRRNSPGAQGGVVNLYSSLDPEILRPIVALAEKNAGIRVRTVGDTEATKTTGLVQRLIAERDRPAADVWWSSEVLGTIKLAQAGLLAPPDGATLGLINQGLADGWPRHLRAADDTWFALGLRPRVLVHHTGRLPANELGPKPDILDPRFKGRFGMARPEFGTTRGHVALIYAAMGPERFGAFARGLRENRTHLYDGNASVVRAVAMGEIDLGLTDFDDVVSGQRNNWPVAALARFEPGPTASTPGSVGLVKGGPNPTGAAKLLVHALSPATEQALLESDFRAIPVRRALFDAGAPWLPPGATPADVPGPDAPDWAAAAANVDAALAALEKALGAG